MGDVRRSRGSWGWGAGFTVCCVFHELLVGEVGLVKEDLSHFRGEF